MKVEHPNTLHRFREMTNYAARTFSMTLNRRQCCCCGQHKPIEGGKVSKGTSRHNPSTFTCADCK